MRLESKKYKRGEKGESISKKVCINEVYISRKGHERITI
jgi:hypothetical protein